MQPDLLIIMAKYPTPGKVNTRLAAADLCRQFIEYHVIEFLDPPFDLEWRYAPARAPFRRHIGNTGAARPQPPGNLGARMRRIFTESFARGYQRVVLIGTDCPRIKQRTVRQALRLLKKYPVVLQPTEDGGCALVGLSGMHDIFSGIAWSTHRVMEQTRRRLHSLGVSFRELPVTFDVDTAADLARLKKGFG